MARRIQQGRLCKHYFILFKSPTGTKRRTIRGFEVLYTCSSSHLYPAKGIQTGECVGGRRRAHTMQFRPEGWRRCQTKQTFLFLIYQRPSIIDREPITNRPGCLGQHSHREINLRSQMLQRLEYFHSSRLQHRDSTEDTSQTFICGTDSPVSIASSTIHRPRNSSTSHGTRFS